MDRSCRHIGGALFFGFLLLSCKPDEDKGPARDTNITTTDLTSPRGWSRGVPILHASELIRGTTSTLYVTDAPVGAQVTFFVSTTNMGEGDCLEGESLCLQILDASEFGEEVADDRGTAEIRTDVEADRPIEVVFYQALVENLENDEAVMTWPVQRQVMIGPDQADVEFTKVTLEVGLNQTYTIGNSHTGGAAWVDINNDYYADLFISNGGGGHHRLYRNEGDGSFTNISEEVRKPDVLMEDAGVKFADVDNDGWSDILVMVDNAQLMVSDLVQPPEGGPNLLYMNQGDGTFEEQAQERGLLDPDGHRNICGGFADIDLDGLIDLHLGEWAMNSEPLGQLDNFDWTAMNVGGTFVDATATTGTDGHGKDALTCGWFDANMDGYPDLYIGHVNDITDAPPGANPMANDVLYLANGDGTYRDATEDSPGFGDDAWAAMGWDVGDVDNDGDWDLYITDRWEVQDPFPRGNPFYINNGDGTFQDNSCDEARICTGYPGWPTNFSDFNRDGLIDLFVGTGRTYYPDLIYINDGDGRFTGHYVTELFDNRSKGGAVADYDGDGDVDLFIWNLTNNSHLFRNEARDDGNWLEIRLLGIQSNRDAIGATAHATTEDGVTQMRRVSGGDSAHSQSELTMHFGFGTQTEVDLRVVWPSGIEQNFSDVGMNRFILVNEQTGVLSEEVEMSASWDATTQNLSVSATSSYGGRTEVNVIDFGQLDYEAASVQFLRTFSNVVSNPGTIQYQTALGTQGQVNVIEQ